ncbi:aminotransferase class V-fold PLP-dependent enzyme [Chengkuizengella axinellae]|uniref:cysteine desulfurase n=1 Tax=Chengkuizengella axinellae TaxID=3064388 RepID=A0ABT9J379_9BACL|nr:aminotransferase class V-fold PLP-dependent enzyme [Chengkuizengella sp. 2205SS18-9]MDP5276070.1 aminotransferase class V-fold PLP-dependent enzyme [Chengkuizengella sp. 2205SS18-9]
MISLKYFDNAASSWPKPKQVVEAMTEAVMLYAANPGRGSHQMAVQASRIIFQTRVNLASLFQIDDPNHISFCLNTTEALNLAIKGILKPKDHVVCTSVEHNSVRRPLEYLKKNSDIEVTYVKTNKLGEINLEEIENAIQTNTKLMICNHSSNLIGSILPIDQINKIAKKHGLITLVDAAQSAGLIPIDVDGMGIDILAFPGHKGLLGPQGTGGIYIHPDIDVEPLMHGGTGSQSEKIEQPTIRPDRYESGTQNTPGIAGLNEGVKFVLNETVEKIHAKEWELTQRLMLGLLNIPQVKILGPKLGDNKTGITSFNVETIEASQVAFRLDRKYNIAVRSGYHCTPLAHETVGTVKLGAVRASVGYFTTTDEVDEFIDAVQNIANR